eukprot:scaffold555275_cov19-Prasinocladus_malaysianus.AAC.1
MATQGPTRFHKRATVASEFKIHPSAYLPTCLSIRGGEGTYILSGHSCVVSSEGVRVPLLIEQLVSRVSITQCLAGT